MVNATERTTYVIHKPFGASCSGPTLTHAYLPIIGVDAFALYVWLASDSSFQRELGKIHSPLARVWKCLGWDEARFENARSRLEGIGLLKTSIHEQAMKRTFHFLLSDPCDWATFLSHNTLQTKLTQAVGTDECERLSLAFTNQVAPTDALDVTTTFEVAYGSETTEVLFDYDQLTKELCVFASQPVFVGADAHTIIDGVAYKTVFADVVRCAKKSLVNDPDLQMVRLDPVLLNTELTALDQTFIATQARYINLKRDPLLFVASDALSDSKREAIFSDYNKHTTERWLQSACRSGLDRQQQETINDLRHAMLLPDALINIILDFMLYRTNGIFRPAYAKKVATSLVAQNISTVKDACRYLISTTKNLVKNATLPSSTPLYEAYQSYQVTQNVQTTKVVENNQGEQAVLTGFEWMK